jgi:hypothetical protein
VAVGVDAVGVDPLYVHTHAELHDRCEADIVGTLEAMNQHGDHYSALDLSDYAENKASAPVGMWQPVSRTFLSRINRLIKHSVRTS